MRLSTTVILLLSSRVMAQDEVENSITGPDDVAVVDPASPPEETPTDPPAEDNAPVEEVTPPTTPEPADPVEPVVEPTPEPVETPAAPTFTWSTCQQCASQSPANKFCTSRLGNG